MTPERNKNNLCIVTGYNNVCVLLILVSMLITEVIMMAIERVGIYDRVALQRMSSKPDERSSVDRHRRIAIDGVRLVKLLPHLVLSREEVFLALHVSTIRIWFK